MLRNSLNKVRGRKGHKGPKAHANEDVVVTRTYQWRSVLTYPLWVLVSFLAANFIVVGILLAIKYSNIDLAKYGSQVVYQTAAAAIVYVLSFAIAFGLPYAIKKQRLSLETLGLSRLMSWSDIGLAPLAFILYAVASAGALALVTSLIPSFPADQAQDTGFSNLSTQIGYLLAFTTLVIIAPIAEETLFRGYLYGKLRERVPIWAAIVVTSLLFGAVHGQWNLAVDTFILSVVMCGLREITGSIWAGMLLHMLKNLLAFYLLFIAPVLPA